MFDIGILAELGLGTDALTPPLRVLSPDPEPLLPLKFQAAEDAGFPFEAFGWALTLALITRTFGAPLDGGMVLRREEEEELERFA